MKKYSSATLSVFVFLTGFLFAMLLLQNLPFQFGDDLNTIHVAKGVPWQKLFLEILNPWTPAWYVHGAESTLTTRVFWTALNKALYQLFGYSPNAFWGLKAVGFAMTGHLGIAAVGSVLFYLLPPIYPSLAWISDPELIVQMFLLIAFYFFLRLYRETPGIRSVVVMAAVIGIASWLGMKVKETARIIPFVFLTFPLLDQRISYRKWLGAHVKNRILVILSLALLLTVIPWVKNPNLALDTRSGSTIFQMNPWGLFSIVPPLLSCLGSVLIVTLLIDGVSFAVGRPKNSTATEPAGAPTIFLFAGVWIGFCLLGFAMNFRSVETQRYLTTSLVPLTIFVIALWWRALRPVLTGIPSRFFRALVIIGCAAGFLIQVEFKNQRIHVGFKLDEIIFMRNYYSGTDIAEYKMTKKIYEDYFRDPDASWQELDRFYRGMAPTKPGEFGVRTKFWDAMWGDPPGEKEKAMLPYLEQTAQKWGAAYVLAFHDNLFQAEPRIQKIFEAKTDNGSLYSFLIARIKKKAFRNFYLYRYRI
ncbi:MAG: hypothetical protein NC930_02745 [Candidatus Omnitrophica bacterium]|nr:hypothetical protein [Candidatus Omnitrophota bacterium]